MLLFCIVFFFPRDYYREQYNDRSFSFTFCSSFTRFSNVFYRLLSMFTSSTRFASMSRQHYTFYNDFSSESFNRKRRFQRLAIISSKNVAFICIYTVGNELIKNIIRLYKNIIIIKFIMKMYFILYRTVTISHNIVDQTVFRLSNKKNELINRQQTVRYKLDSL